MTKRCRLCKVINEVDEDGFCFQCSEDLRISHIKGDETIDQFQLDGELIQEDI